jgi:hypothetical protein
LTVEHAHLHSRAFALARLVQHPRIRVRGRKLLGDLRRGVAAVVIDDDDFDAYAWAATNRSTCSRLVGRRLASLYAGIMMDSSGGVSMFDPHGSRA